MNVNSDLVPNNNTQVTLRAVEVNPITGRLQPATGKTITLWVAASPTATGPITTLTYTFTEMSQVPGDYVVTILGTNIESELNNATYMNTRVYLIASEGSTIHGYTAVLVRPVREL